MSLIIELESVYTCNGQIQNKIQCLCKIIFRNSTKNISLYENGSSLGTKLLKSDEFYEEDEVISFLSQTSSRIKFGLGTKIKLDDVLRIECYKPGKFQKKFVTKSSKIVMYYFYLRPFGVYTMLLESLTVTEKSIEIDDFLSDPKKNILIQVNFYIWKFYIIKNLNLILEFYYSKSRLTRTFTGRLIISS